MSGTELLITDQDVLALLAQDDEIASTIGAAFASLPASAQSSGAIAAWNVDAADYAVFAANARAQASGGFFFGAWWGVPDLYHEAESWGARLMVHADDAKALGASVGSLPAIPAPPTPLTMPTTELGDFGVGAGTGLLVGVVAAALVVLFVRR